MQKKKIKKKSDEPLYSKFVLYKFFGCMIQTVYRNCESFYKKMIKLKVIQS